MYCKQVCFIPLALCICDKQKKKKKIEQGTHDEYEDSNICEGLFRLVRLMMRFKMTSKGFVNEM